MRTWFYSLRALCVCLWLCGVPSAVHAGPVESVRDAILHPTNPDIITLLYANAGGGVIHTTDRGEHWGLVCNSALGVNRDPFSATMSASGELYMGFFTEMLQDDGGRCSFDQVPAFDGQWVSDLSLRPDDPTGVLAITSAGGMDNGIWMREGTGAFKEVGAREQVLISRVRMAVLPGGGERFYESIARGETMEMVDGFPRFFPNYFVRSSDDGALTWTEHAFPKTQGTLRLELIDPTDPNRVVVSVDNSEEGSTDFVFVSDDGGANFRQIIEVEQFGGAAWSTDGRLWVGDQEGGLFVGALTDDTLSMEDDKARPTCVRFDPVSEQLYICESFGFGTYDPTAKTFQQLFDITDIGTFVDCSDSRDLVGECEEQMFAGYCGPSHFPTAAVCWMSYPDRVSPPDAGGATGGNGASGSGGTGGSDDGGSSDDDGTRDAGSPESSGGDGGCSILHQDERSPSWMALAPICLAAFRLRRRARKA